ncbi:MAG: thiamine biosynthesis protein ThiS [Candidatus Schekmanbacteria bacterium RBG_13_48_7]|uniref:Thiamine biosynthesis protein ThiS n=1 Tax=Candidatus Schekmanbacteria bacterium RBG_13_48_7 TaxID=1817878 RepID=A0A1F7S7S4_9BACT|nr:MAG: thiamine biosynthesis protein ThiS [Candidatus Schekmanbacteria bacterium RBG_13_48_7]
MIVKVNGEEIELEDGKNVSDLLQRYDLQPEAVAVEINYEIIPRFRYGEVQLKLGDCIEIVNFVGGG